LCFFAARIALAMIVRVLLGTRLRVVHGPPWPVGWRGDRFDRHVPGVPGDPAHAEAQSRLNPWSAGPKRIIMTGRIAEPKWRNWQTRRIQNPFPARGCGFDSHLRQSVSPRESARKTSSRYGITYSERVRPVAPSSTSRGTPHGSTLTAGALTGSRLQSICACRLQVVCSEPASFFLKSAGFSRLAGRSPRGAAATSKNAATGAAAIFGNTASQAIHFNATVRWM
jgi:hypothetical protein